MLNPALYRFRSCGIGPLRALPGIGARSAVRSALYRFNPEAPHQEPGPEMDDTDREVIHNGRRIHRFQGLRGASPAG